MPLEFHKMHGAGNDFVLVDARRQPFEVSPQQAARIADRRRGIGCDQILVLRPAEDETCLLRYEIWNTDGSRAAQCGNGARCIALYMEMTGEAPNRPFDVESPSGRVTMSRHADGEYEIDMGTPRFEPQVIPLELEPEDGLYHVDSPWGVLEFGAASMGNPHALLVCESIDNAEIPEIGAFLGANAVFPEGVNVGFCQVLNPGEIRLRVIERGAGETLACGSGACAAVAILQRLGLVGERVDVALPGGHLVIKWRGNNKTLIMKGPAKHVFRGIMNE